MDAKRSLVHNWMMKARRDLFSAKRLTRGNDPYFDTAIYHCQQTVEKAFQAASKFYDFICSMLPPEVSTPK